VDFVSAIGSGWRNTEYGVLDSFTRICTMRMDMEAFVHVRPSIHANPTELQGIDDLPEKRLMYASTGQQYLYGTSFEPWSSLASLSHLSHNGLQGVSARPNCLKLPFISNAGISFQEVNLGSKQNPTSKTQGVQKKKKPARCRRPRPLRRTPNPRRGSHRP
jgi:hypothetical protein